MTGGDLMFLLIVTLVVLTLFDTTPAFPPVLVVVVVEEMEAVSWRRGSLLVVSDLFVARWMLLAGFGS